MSDIWFTSDLHFGHKNIAGPDVSKWESGFRTFESIEEMDNTIISNINENVKENDILYILGDFTFGGIEKVKRYRKQINCRNIHLVLGNHDLDKKKLSQLILPPGDGFLSIEHKIQTNINNQYIVMDHYSHRVWHHNHRGAWHLYGHSHDSLEYIKWGKSMDVGIDAAFRIFGEYRPFHFDEIKLIMDSREKLAIDHHDDSENHTIRLEFNDPKIAEWVIRVFKYSIMENYNKNAPRRDEANELYDELSDQIINQLDLNNYDHENIMNNILRNKEDL